jgi:hypothetical protein
MYYWLFSTHKRIYLTIALKHLISPQRVYKICHDPILQDEYPDIAEELKKRMNLK